MLVVNPSALVIETFPLWITFTVDKLDVYEIRMTAQRCLFLSEFHYCVLQVD